MKQWIIRQTKTLRERMYTNRIDLWCGAIILLVTLMTHGFNMAHYPYYENDEATYVSRGWSVVSEGDLDPYTYRYDHAPMGWLVIAGWQAITGGTAFFDSFLLSGRVLMLVIAAAAALLTYLIARRLTNSALASLIAVLIVAVSPLAIYFQRRVLLDNVMTLFILLAMYFALDPKRRLGSYQLSALSFGLAILSKLVAVFALPAVLLLVIGRALKVSRAHVLIQWLGIVGVVVGLFIIYAALKGELLPAPLDAHGMPTHVSLIETTREQLSRGVAKLPWDPTSAFYQNMADWLRRDAFLMLAGIGAAVLSLFFALKRRLYFVITLYCFGFLFFFARGKLVLNHYLLPLLPGLAFALALFLSQLLRGIKRLPHSLLKAIALIIVLVSTSYGVFSYQTAKPYRVDENYNLLAAQDWVRKNVSKDALIITDNYAYPDLHDKYGFRNIYYMFPAEYDPAVRQAYGSDWHNIEYLIVTHEMYKQMKSGSLPTVKFAFEHAYPLAEFKAGSTSYIDDRNLISTNGDWAAIYRVDPDAQLNAYRESN